jgi:hypothetical protein
MHGKCHRTHGRNQLASASCYAITPVPVAILGQKALSDSFGERKSTASHFSHEHCHLEGSDSMIFPVEKHITPPVPLLLHMYLCKM